MPNVPEVPNYKLPGNPQYNPPSNPSVPGSEYSKITNAIIVIIMILVITVLAGFDKDLGHILVVFMSGIFLLWLLGPGTTDISKWLKPLTGTATGVEAV